jgi:hypothetical protein
MTTALGLTPKRSWMAGAPRKTPKGNPLEGVYDASYWTCRLVDGTWPDRELPAAIEAALDQLAPKQDWFVEIAASGGTSELFVGWFFDEGNSGDTLDHRLLGRLSSFAMNLSFDVYPELQT